MKECKFDVLIYNQGVEIIRLEDAEIAIYNFKPIIKGDRLHDIACYRWAYLGEPKEYKSESHPFGDVLLKC
ncbi:hypothetical protein MKW98_011394 [Papaver atlanticum]|uniref:Uncharacterized protein n=1 Tax=Papaver atlanticum TaxID=357466 RepID=A0AAD4SVX8_9MAGN|nr:hypothetical protein MKW98_011394 [Papaver atlanticum]